MLLAATGVIPNSAPAGQAVLLDDGRVVVTHRADEDYDTGQQLIARQ